MNGIYGSLCKTVAHPLESAMRFSVRLSELRHDPDFFQKAFQVLGASLSLAGYSAGNSLIRIFHTVNMHDVFACNKLFHRAVYGNITPRTIDDNRVLANLAASIRVQGGFNREDSQAIARKCLGEELRAMDKSEGKS